MKLNLAYVFLWEFSFFFLICALHRGEKERIGFLLQDSLQTCRTHLFQVDRPYPVSSCHTCRKRSGSALLFCSWQVSKGLTLPWLKLVL